MKERGKRGEKEGHACGEKWEGVSVGERKKLEIEKEEHVKQKRGIGGSGHSSGEKEEHVGERGKGVQIPHTSSLLGKTEKLREQDEDQGDGLDQGD